MCVVTLSAATTSPLQPNQTLSMILEDGGERDLQAAGPLRLVGARHGYPVGDENQPRQYLSSQERDSRMAVRISPAME